MSGLLERVVEDWLTSADERGYQLAFASALGQEGHTIKYVSPHSALEHGKDIVSLKPSRKIHAYQLKAGTINMSVWRKVSGEVREAAIVPVDIPGVPRRVADSAYLVLTGHLTDSVRNQIGLMNDDLSGRGYSRISVIQLPELVGMLSSAFETFFPRTVGPTTELLRLYLRDGRGPQDKASLHAILGQMLPASTARRQVARSLSNLVVAAQFVTTPFRNRGNHIAEMDTWTIAACVILLCARDKRLRKEQWKTSYELCWAGLTEASEKLLEEVLSSSDFREGGELSESVLIGYRRTLALGYAGAFINSKKISDADVREVSESLFKVVQRERPLQGWGESAWNFVLNLVLAMRHTPEGSRFSDGLVLQWLREACPTSPPYESDPYTTLEDAIASLAEPQSDVTPQVRVSYSAESALAHLVRRMYRRQVAPSWPAVSRFQFARFVPDRLRDYFQWRNDEGVMELRTLPFQESWSALRSGARNYRFNLFGASELPLLPFFLCAFPHRVDPYLSGELDYLTSPVSFRSEWTSTSK